MRTIVATRIIASTFKPSVTFRAEARIEIEVENGMTAALRAELLVIDPSSNNYSPDRHSSHILGIVHLHSHDFL
jgi:hypothetical protein